MSNSESNTNQDCQVLDGHTSDVTWCDFNSNQYLASSSNDKTIRLWKINQNGAFEELSQSPYIGHRYGVNCIRFSPFGTILASVSTDGYIFLWNIQV